MIQANFTRKYSIIIHLTYVRGVRDINTSYSFFRNIKCPLNKEICAYNGNGATLCSCGTSRGLRKICICKATHITEEDIKNFTDNIGNIIGGIVANQIMSDVHQK